MSNPTPTEELAQELENAVVVIPQEFPTVRANQHLAATRLHELATENQRLRESRRELAERAWKAGIQWLHLRKPTDMRDEIDALLAEEPSDAK